jgi:HEPN domain-containing protein
VARLLGELPPELAVGRELGAMAHHLGGYYIPARYPNAHPEGAPFEHYGELQSRQAVEYAREILDFVRAQMA